MNIVKKTLVAIGVVFLSAHALASNGPSENTQKAPPFLDINLKETGIIFDDESDSKRFASTLVISPNGRLIVVYEGETRTAIIWDANTGKKINELKPNFTINFYEPNFSATFSPDSQKLIIVEQEESSSKPGRIGIWDLYTGEKLFESNHAHFKFSADSKKILTWDELELDSGKTGSKSVTLFNTDSGKIIYEFTQENRFIRGAQFTLDGKKVLIWGNSLSKEENPTTLVWDVESGKNIFELKGEYSKLSPNDKKLLTCQSEEGGARIWDVNSGKLLLYIAKFQFDSMNDKSNSANCNTSRFNLNGKILLAHQQQWSPNDLLAFNAETGETLYQIEKSVDWWDSLDEKTGFFQISDPYSERGYYVFDLESGKTLFKAPTGALLFGQNYDRAQNVIINNFEEHGTEPSDDEYKITFFDLKFNQTKYEWSLRGDGFYFDSAYGKLSSNENKYAALLVNKSVLDSDDNPTYVIRIWSMLE